MEYTTLGRSGLEISRLCLGTMNFGSRASEADSFRIMDRALELGINFFDTANVYGGKKYEGLTEQIVGRWFAQGDGRRDRVVLATKYYNPMWDGPNSRGVSAYHVRRTCKDSLRRLQTDHIDLYQMHHIDRRTPWDEAWQAAEVLTQQGKVLYFGSSNFAGWHIATANAAAAKRNFLGLVSEQTKYSLNCRTAELEVLPSCRHHGVGVIPWSPLDGGLLGGVLDLDDSAGDRRLSQGMRQRTEQNRAQLQLWEELCRELNEEPAAVALAWLLHQDGVDAPIIGPRTMEQLTSAPLRALDLELDTETLAKIDEIWPGPGGEAPEAYAW